MVQIVLILSLFLVGLSAFTQTDINSRIKTSASYAVGWQTEATKEYFVHGSFGFRPKETKIELRGDGFYFLNAKGNRPRFSVNHQLFAGAFYRFSNKNFQPYLGFQPGIAFSQSSEYGVQNSETGELEFETTINPVGSFAGGLELFGKEIFYAFVEARYIFGKHTSHSYPIYLDEFRLSFGLGFHF